MKYLTFLPILFLVVACDPSHDMNRFEREDYAKATCDKIAAMASNPMKEKELKKARKKLGLQPTGYMRARHINDSLEYGICPNLVLHIYESQYDNSRRDERRRIRIEKEKQARIEKEKQAREDLLAARKRDLLERKENGFCEINVVENHYNEKGQVYAVTVQNENIKVEGKPLKTKVLAGQIEPYQTTKDSYLLKLADEDSSMWQNTRTERRQLMDRERWSCRED